MKRLLGPDYRNPDRAPEHLPALHPPRGAPRSASAVPGSRPAPGSAPGSAAELVDARARRIEQADSEVQSLGSDIR